MIRFEVPMIPVAKGRAKFARMGNFVRAYTPTKTREAEHNFMTFASQFAPKSPIDGPVTVRLSFVFAAPRAPKWKRAAALDGAFMHTTRPDVDNLAKLAMDALTSSGQWWTDDARVVSLEARKRYGERPMTVVEIDASTIDEGAIRKLYDKGVRPA